MGKFQVSLNDEATAEFERLLENLAVCELAKRYFKELFEFPPEAWGDIHRKEGQTLFKSDNHVIFDIQGKVLTDGEGQPYEAKSPDSVYAGKAKSIQKESLCDIVLVSV